MQITHWQLCFDADDCGVRDGWHEPARQPEEDAWHDITVPCAWNEVFGDDSPDIAWYRTEVPRASRPEERVWLSFAAVCTGVTAWCDGQQIGKHLGNWEPFAFELPAFDDGHAPHRIVLRVDRVRPAPQTTIGDRVIQHGHITKGFHDVLSRQPAGLWQPVEWVCTGPHAFEPLGVTVLADLDSGALTVDLRVSSRQPGTGQARVCITQETGGPPATEPCVFPITDGAQTLGLRVANPSPWSPQCPTLYTLRVELFDPSGRVSDKRVVRFGFRKAETRGRKLLLNGRPIHLSAILDWGHEPMQTAPAPSRSELRRRFESLRAMGFNCLCVCLWYPPQSYYDLADEMGMLVWQEHPLWKPEMTPENRDTFMSHFERFFRMDMNHPSVVIVSGSCEHDAMDPQVAAWWWRRANELLPDRLLQVQTAFLRLVPPEQTDLYDEHTYENSGRWPEFLADMDHTLAPLDAKPFVMGESVLYNDWPDAASMPWVVGDERPWWVSKVLDHVIEIEQKIVQRFGTATLDRFRHDARRWNIQGRKWQTEVFRHNGDHAGLVQNGLRDVAQCPLGFMDDMDRWRMTPEHTRPWLAPNALLLRTPNHMRAFRSGNTIHLEVGASSFDRQPVGDTLELHIRADGLGFDRHDTRTWEPTVGGVVWESVEVDLPQTDQPILLDIEAHAAGAPANRWRVCVLPTPPALPERLAVVPPQRDAPVTEFEEACYSSGWGLEVRSWQMAVPDTTRLLPDTRCVDAPAPGDAGVLVAHTLTPALIGWVEDGGRLLLLPDRSPESIPLRIPTLWGQSPLVIDQGPLAGVGHELVLDTLDRDLHHRWVRSVPTAELGIADDVMPYIRLYQTHDAIDRVRILDDLFASRVGRGMVLVSALDHTTVAGGWLLHRLLGWLAGPDHGVECEISAEQLAKLIQLSAAHASPTEIDLR